LACRRLIDTSSEVIIVPSPVLAEVDYLVYSRLSSRLFWPVLEDIMNGRLLVEDLILEDYVRIRSSVSATPTRISAS
jgi:hypothetical protein